MKNLKKANLFWLLSVILLAGCGNPMLPADETTPDWAPAGAVKEELAPQAPVAAPKRNQIIVAVKPGAKLIRVQSAGERVVQSLKLSNSYQVVELPEGMSVEEGKALYAKNPAVAYVAENRFYHTTAVNDPLASEQWASSSKRLDLEPVWAKNIDASGVVVAILDSGIDYNHPDLQGRVMRGWNFMDNSSDIMDRVGHGTHVAGIIGASAGNGIGVAGVANCKLMAIKVLNDQGTGTTDAVAAGIKYAADYGAKVINMSLGSSNTQIDPVIHDALEYARAKGCVAIAAAGNDHSAVGCPANDPLTVAVSSTSHFLSWEYISWFSNRGPEVAVAAPGGGIMSTLPTSSNLMGKTMYGKLSGTSMAAPFVSGEAALLFALHPNWSADSVVNQIVHSADQKKGGKNIYYGWGRINIHRAIN
ncbi:MAG: S8 family peptidase [Bacteroidota bacterium]